MDVFFKQRDDMFFPTWAFVVPTTMLRFPVSLVESGIFTALTYYSVGLASNPDRSAPHLTLTYHQSHCMQALLCEPPKPSENLKPSEPCYTTYAWCTESLVIAHHSYGCATAEQNASQLIELLCSLAACLQVALHFWHFYVKTDSSISCKCVAAANTLHWASAASEQQRCAQLLVCSTQLQQ